MRGQLGPHARAEQVVVVDDDDPQAAHETTPIRSAISVPSPGRDSTTADPTDRGHPPHDRVAHAAPLGRDRRELEARALVAHEHLGAVGARLPEDEDRRARRVPRGVAQRLARGGGERLGGPVEPAIPQHRELHDRTRVVLDLGDRGPQRGAQRLRAELDLARHPRPQLVLLAAREPRDRGRVVRLALDQRERLQHRVVQVRGDAPPLVLARVLHAHPVGARETGDQHAA